MNGGGEGVSFLDGCGRGAEFVGGSGDGAIGNGDGGFGDSVGERFVSEESDAELFGAFFEAVGTQCMGEGKGPGAGDDAGAVEGAFAEVFGIDARAADGPEECGAGCDVGGLNGGGEGVAFLDGCGRGAEFVGRCCNRSGG